MRSAFYHRFVVFSLSLLALCALPLLSAAETQQYPDVLNATVTDLGSQWRISATMSSPYDTPERYADGFRVLTEDGTELGVRTLWHDHAGEQPFTRSLSGVEIPAGRDYVIIQGRDQRYGWGGQVVRVRLRDGEVTVLEAWP